MNKIDTIRQFIPLNIAVMTVSDSRTPETDTTGDFLCQRIQSAGHALAARAVVTKDISMIRHQLLQWIADENVDVVVSTGGTGLAERDVTPEAFKSVYEKDIECFTAIFHRISFEKVGLSALQSRATGGVAHGTYLFALPGAVSACRDGWDEILVHQFDNRARPSNFVEYLPRLQGLLAP